MKYTFIISESIFYAAFLILDFFDIYHKQASVLKFSGIILCFLYLLTGLITEKIKRGIFSKDRVIMTIALFFTVIADIFLLFTENYISGICFFIIVQGIYLYRISKSLIISLKYCLLYRIIFTCIILVLISYYNTQIDYIIIAVCFYFICFLDNIRLLRISHKANKEVLQGNPDTFKYFLFFTGMILFVLCDVNVGLYNMSDYVHINNNILGSIIGFSEKGMWLFYLPSQVFMVFSVEYTGF